MTRASVSSGPPAGNGTINVMGRIGKAWALAMREAAGSATAPAASCRNRRRGSSMASSSGLRPASHGASGRLFIEYPRQNSECRDTRIMLYFDRAIARMYQARTMQPSDHVGRRMKLQDLYVLMAVVQAGSMRKAAVQLNTNQPSISRSIAELEHTLGVQLLDRNPHGVEPTQYGRALLECGAAVFDDLHQGVKSIEFLADPKAGEVRIGSTPFLAATFVSGVVDRLSRRYPRIVFHLVATQSDALGHELSERNVDLVIASLRGGLVTDEKFSFDVLYDDSIV